MIVGSWKTSLSLWVQATFRGQTLRLPGSMNYPPSYQEVPLTVVCACFDFFSSLNGRRSNLSSASTELMPFPTRGRWRWACSAVWGGTKGSLLGQGIPMVLVHPGKLTWNSKMEVWFRWCSLPIRYLKFRYLPFLPSTPSKCTSPKCFWYPCMWYLKTLMI